MQSSTTSSSSASTPIIAGDGVGAPQQNPFHATFSSDFAAWMTAYDLSLGFTTYTAGKVVLLGPGRSGSIAVSERNFGQAMALRATENGFYLFTRYQVWRFENGLDVGASFDG